MMFRDKTMMPTFYTDTICWFICWFILFVLFLKTSNEKIIIIVVISIVGWCEFLDACVCVSTGFCDKIIMVKCNCF